MPRPASSTVSPSTVTVHLIHPEIELTPHPPVAPVSQSPRPSPAPIRRYNARMNNNHESSLIDLDGIKRAIAEAIRVTIRERAVELGISYAACIDLLLKKEA
jgi:hypothetical protein